MFARKKSSFFVGLVLFYIMIAVFAYVYRSNIRYQIKKAIVSNFIKQSVETLQPEMVNLDHGDSQVNQASSQKEVLTEAKIDSEINFISQKLLCSISPPETKVDYYSLFSQWESIYPKEKFEVQPFDKDRDKGLSFNKRINEHLMTCCRIAIKKASEFTQRAFFSRSPAQFFLEISKDGDISQLILTGSSGCPVVDQFTIESVKSAEPFPQIPNHLGVLKFQVAN
jgi:hypothetical protein